MKTGFMDFAATRIIPEMPGHTARWYANEYLQLGSNLSDAKDTIASLANTLEKQVRTGREKRVRREHVNGKYMFYPAVQKAIEEYVSIHLPLSTSDHQDISNLIEVGKFKNIDESIEWLVSEGIKNNRDYLDRLSKISAQIESLKKQI